MVRVLLAAIVTATLVSSAGAQPGKRMSTAAPAAEQSFYNPAADPAVVFGDDLVREVAEDAFGWFMPAMLPLSLDGPLSPDESAVSGRNGLGQPFVLELGVLQPFRIAGREFIAWEGVISGPMGTSRPVCGLYTADAASPLIVPVIRSSDDARAWEAHQSLVAAWDGIGPRRWLCELDAHGQSQADANEIEMRRCSDNARRRVIAIDATCLVLGGGTCIWTGFAGCVAGIACEVSLGIDFWRWTGDFASNDLAASLCLCVESQFRQQNPGQQAPSNCGNFECPDPPSPIPGIRF